MAHEVAERTVVEAAVAAGYDDLRPAHFRLLRFPGIEATRPAELVARLRTSKQALNPLLRDLESWGYISLATLADDQRGRIIRLTPRGRALMSTVWEAHGRLDARREKRIGPRRYETLKGALRQLVDEQPPSAADRVTG